VSITEFSPFFFFIKRWYPSILPKVLLNWAASRISDFPSESGFSAVKKARARKIVRLLTKIALPECELQNYFFSKIYIVVPNVLSKITSCQARKLSLNG